MKAVKIKCPVVLKISRSMKDFQKQLQECEQLLKKLNADGFFNIHAGCVDAWHGRGTKHVLISILHKKPIGLPFIVP